MKTLPRAVGLMTLATLALTCWAARASAQLSPDEELQSLKADAPFEVTLFAAEPLITNPAAIDVDTHGRVWVAEIQWYRSGAKNPPADKIKVLEDTDGDGRADKVTVFADGIFAPMSICVAGTKVYVATSPDLWVFEDKDGDLRADGPPQKLLTGFGGHNHDHGAHSLVLGPDHKWWMSHGDQGFDVRGTDGSRIQYKWGAMLRGELDGSRLETIAVNFRNPYEICVSSFGEAYVSDNDNDGNESVRICWILEGGNYGWFGGPPFSKPELAGRLSKDTPFREHWHFRGYMPGYVPGTLITGFGSPTGMCYYEGDAFGPHYKNVPLHTDAGPRECRAYPHERVGFGMQASSEVILSTTRDKYFRPDDICAGPDGRLFVSDWYDGGVGGHAYNNPDQGRVFVLQPRGKKLTRHDKPGPYHNTADAIEGLKSPNLATQFLARERLLADGAASVPALEALVTEGAPNYAARALWLLDRIGGPARELVVADLASSDAARRALAVRILRRHGAEHAQAILQLAADPAAEVRREVLLAIRTLEGESAMAALTQIASTFDGADRYQLEAIHVAAGGRGKQLLERLEKSGPLRPTQFALLQVLDSQRAAQTLLARLDDDKLDEKSARPALEEAMNTPSVDAGWKLLNLAAGATRPLALRRTALEKLTANLARGSSWNTMIGDERFTATLRGLLGDADLRRTALATVDKLQIAGLGGEVLAIAANRDVERTVRQQAVSLAVRLHPSGIGDALRSLAEGPERQVASTAVKGLVDLHDIRALREVFSSERFSPDVRTKAAERLVESPSGALVLLKLIDDNQVPEDVKNHAVAKGVRHADAGVRVLFEKFVPEENRPKKLGKEIPADEILALSGDANRGRQIFTKSSAAQCKQCHAVQGFGGQLGPDLSNIGKKYERKVLLETIIDPSKAIAPEFIPQLLETTTGLVYVGFIVERTDDHVVLKDAKSQLIRVAASEIESLVPQQKSLMPELVLSEVTAQDAADLLAFLESCK